MRAMTITTGSAVDLTKSFLTGSCTAAKKAVNKIRENKNAMWALRFSARWLIVILAIVAWSLVMVRVGQRKALAVYEGWMEEYRVERLAIDQAGAYSEDAASTPEADTREQIITEIAKCIRGLKRFNYGYADFWRMAWCMDARTRSSSYSDDLLSVIQQQGQWPGYSADNEVTAGDYKMAERVYDAISKADHPPVSNEFVYASFELDGVTLRDTYEITSKTHFWKGEPDA